MSQTFSEILFSWLSFLCMKTYAFTISSLPLLTYSIICEKKYRSLKTYNYYNHNLLTDTFTATVWSFMLKDFVFVSCHIKGAEKYRV
jgi:hypothetical protein